MKISFELELGSIEVDTNTETGRIDSIWINGNDFADKTVEELIMAVVGGHDRWSQLIANEEYRQNQASKELPDRSEDVYGVPI